MEVEGKGRQMCEVCWGVGCLPRARLFLLLGKENPALRYGMYLLYRMAFGGGGDQSDSPRMRMLDCGLATDRPSPTSMSARADGICGRQQVHKQTKFAMLAGEGEGLG